MDRPMTREGRIQAHMTANQRGPYAAITATRGYCEALVDGEDEIELANAREQRIREHLGITGSKIAANQLLDRQKVFNDLHKANERILEQMEQKNMTRDEAKNTLAMNSRGVELDYRDAFLDCAEALGLIKFEEPKSAEQKAIEALRDCPLLDKIAPFIIMRCLNESGLKIVEK